MALDIFKEKGVPLSKQQFHWKELAGQPISKLNTDALSRVRIILMNGIEQQQNRFLHHMAQFNNGQLRVPLAQVRRVDHHQQTLVNWLLPADQSPLETTIAYEQVAIEVTAGIAQHEPDPYVKQALDFGLLEDFDHMYRYSALMDRVEGKDANNILQSYTDIIPGRPTMVEHRAPEDDVRRPYDKKKVHPLTRLHALTLVGGEYQTRDYYMNVGPTFSDPMARMLYAEIASIEEQHVTHYESLCDPSESWMEKWLLYEACEVYNYLACANQETHPRLKAIWERFVEYELGQLHFAMEHFKKLEKRDPAEVLPQTLPEPFKYQSNRDYVRKVLKDQVHLRAVGTEFVDPAKVPESEATLQYRNTMNQHGSPTEIVAEGYVWRPGTELVMGRDVLPEINQGRLQ